MATSKKIRFRWTDGAKEQPPLNVRCLYREKQLPAKEAWNCDIIRNTGSAWEGWEWCALEEQENTIEVDNKISVAIEYNSVSAQHVVGLHAPKLGVSTVIYVPRDGKGSLPPEIYWAREKAT